MSLGVQTRWVQTQMGAKQVTFVIRGNTIGNPISTNLVPHQTI